MLKFIKPMKKEKIFLYIIFGIIILTISYNYVFRPIFKKYTVMNRKIKILEDRLNDYQLLIKNKDRIMQLQKNLPNGYIVNESKEKMAISILKEIERLIKINNINLLNIRPQDDVYKDDIVLELKIEADIKDISKFIYDIENSFYLLTIKHLDLMPSQLKKDTLECDIILIQEQRFGLQDRGVL